MLNQYHVRVGSIVWFEYHCNESHDSDHAQWWYRSHEKVKILRRIEKGEGKTIGKRCLNGHQAIYTVQFTDGFVGDVFEDELMKTKRFYRPAPPKQFKKLLTSA